MIIKLIFVLKLILPVYINRCVLSVISLLFVWLVGLIIIYNAILEVEYTQKCDYNTSLYIHGKAVGNLIMDMLTKFNNTREETLSAF